MSEKMFTIKTESNEKGGSARLKELESRLETLSQVVGADFGMKCRFGEPGKGSFFNPAENTITFDPLMVQDGKEWLIEFVAGHEGGHRAISRSLKQMGVRDEKAIELYGRIGFGYSENTHEDCSDNDWVASVFEKFRESAARNYAEAFQEENAVMSTTESKKIMDMLGYVPKFVMFNSEMMRAWATGGYSKELDHEVRSALEKTAGSSEEYWRTIPGKLSGESERLDAARERFRIFYENIWPEIDRLVKLDIDEEKLRQMAEEMLKNMKPGGEGEQGRGNAPRLPQALEDALRKAMEKQLKENLDKIAKELDDLKAQLDKTTDTKEKEEIEKKISELLGGKKEQEKGEGATIPWDKLSDEMKKKLREIYDRLPKSVRDELKDKAEAALKNADDILVEGTRGKLTDGVSPLTHKEADEAKAELEARQKREDAERKKMEQETRAREKLQREMARRIEGDLGEYDRIYREVAPLADELYARIRKIFLPHKHPRWVKGKPTGQRLDLFKVMQFQADRTQYDKLWEQKTMPQKSDFRFTLLNDLSSSMDGSKIEQDFRAKIMVTEVLNRLGIKTQILGFQDKVIKYKDFGEELSPAIRQHMTVMRREPNGAGENNKGAWNSDGFCLLTASEMLKREKARDSFLLVLSDGLPAPDPEHAGEEYELSAVIAEVRKNTRQKLVGLGIGPDTEHVKRFYPTSLPGVALKDLPRLLGDLLEDMIKNPGRYK